ncbi:hypothetical protein B0H14DRAFT_3082648 [Mycena olivaceomarginata]|nr:hypothetical protein B0H14DRAFT_3082648 [Mycena olivaceomarginata]
MQLISRILAGQLFDPYLLRLVPNQLITVSLNTGLVLDVCSYTSDQLPPETIGLRHLTVVPGFVDAHVHFLLHSYSKTSWADQVTKESLESALYARKTLLAGYTSVCLIWVRDLGTEGAEDDDIALQKCLVSGPQPLVPGPRYFTANRAIVSTGSYGLWFCLQFCPKGSIHFNKEGVESIVGAEAADGPDECIRAVRKQIGAGADWIKVCSNFIIRKAISYSYMQIHRSVTRITPDYPVRSRLTYVSPRLAGRSIATFNHSELKALIDTAHQYGVKIAAHAKTVSVIKVLLELGIDSLEHGLDLHTSTDAVRTLASSGCRTVYVPMFAAAGAALLHGKPPKRHSPPYLLAQGLGKIALACGGDTRVFPHGENALEMELMVRLGAPWEWVLRWVTLGGWECIIGEQDAGTDALAITPICEDGSVEFVMKAGRVYNQGGNQVI